MKRAFLTVASLALVFGGTAACGGSPKDASVDDFCEAAMDVTGIDDAKGMKDWAENMDKVGTPKDMPDDARDGFELIIKTAKKVDDDASEEEMNDLDKDFSDEDDKNSDAFGEYVGKNCTPEMPDMPEMTPTN